MAKSSFDISVKILRNGRVIQVDNLKLPGGESYELEVEGVAHWHSDHKMFVGDDTFTEVFLAKLFLDVDEAGKITKVGDFKVFKSGRKSSRKNYSDDYYAPNTYNVTIKGDLKGGGKSAILAVSYDAKTRKDRNHKPYSNADSIKFKGIPAQKEKDKQSAKPRKVRVLNIDVGTFPYGEYKFSSKVKGKSSNHHGYSEFKKAILAGSKDLRMDMRTGVLATKHKIVITAYADYTGPAPENDRLAKRRGEEVQKMVMGVLGVKKDRFAAIAGRQITKKKVVRGDRGNPASRYVTVILPWQYV